MYTHDPSLTNLSRDAISTRLQPFEKNHFMDKNYYEYKIKPKTESESTSTSTSTKTKTSTKQLNNVIVLADNKNYSREFLQCLGMSSGSPYLCTKHIPTKMFTFQIYGLEESDEKIFTHVKTNAGLIIITTHDIYVKLLDQIYLYCKKITWIPILIVLENCLLSVSDEINLEHKVNLSNVKYEFLSYKFNHTEYLRGTMNLKNL
jgi:hypothetical protein